MNGFERLRAPRLHAIVPPIRIHTLFLLLMMACLLPWYVPPTFCNPCVWPPRAFTGVVEPDDAIVVSVYFGRMGHWVTVYPTFVGEWGYGTAYAVRDLEPLIWTAASCHPGSPVVLRAAAEAPAETVLFVLHQLQAFGLTHVYFETLQGIAESTVVAGTTKHRPELRPSPRHSRTRIGACLG